MENEKAFKNWINPLVVKKMGDVFYSVYPEFDKKRFFKLASKLGDMELKARVIYLTEGLRIELPGVFEKDAQILNQVLKANKLTSFELWPISEYISKFGHNNFDESFELMYQLTQQFTSEFAIRPFLQNNPKQVLSKLKKWLNDDNVHVRRWISEGTRPLLPWGGKIQSFIETPITINLLDRLKYDDEIYVRKSVANHLNDISKHHPDLVIETLKAWLAKAPKDQIEKIQWIKKQALRTLIKKGDTKAIGLMGASGKGEVRVLEFELNQEEFSFGDELKFQFVLESTAGKEQKLIIDYGIAFVKSNGTLSTKIFKLKMIQLGPKERIIISKKHSLKKITTMTFYPGEHELFLQVNGKIIKKHKWMLKK